MSQTHYRRLYIDNIRSITILLVVIYHVFYMFNGIEGLIVLGPFSYSQIQDSVQYFLYPWFMVILFIISGMCSRYYLETHSALEFRKSRTLKLLVPSTIGLVVFQWIQGYVNMKIFNTAETMGPEVPKIVSIGIMILSGSGVLWFVQVLWLYSMILLLVAKLEKGKFYGKTAKTPLWVLLLLAVPFWASSQLLNTPIISVYRFGIYGFSFFVGYFVLSHDEVIDRLSENWIALTSIALVLGILYVVFYFGKNYATVPVVNCVLASAYGWFACLSFLGIGKRFLDKSGLFWSFLKRNNWGIYVFHYLGASGCGLLMRGTGIPALAQYFLCFLSSFFVSFFLYHLISRIPFLRWCVLGINKKQR